MEYIYETVRSICAFIILTTVINNLLHGSSYRKYIRFFEGMILIVIVIKPLANIDNLALYELRLESYELKNELNLYESEAAKKIQKEYVKTLDNQLSSIVAENELRLVESTWDVNMDSTSDDYGSIESVYVKASMTSEISITDVHIDEEGNASLMVRSEALASRIAEHYGIDEKCIEVNVVA